MWPCLYIAHECCQVNSIVLFMHIAHECSQVIIVLQFMYLLYGFSKFSILIGCQAVRKNTYPDRGPYFSYLDRIPGCRLSGGKFLLAIRKNFCFLIFQLCVIKIYSETSEPPFLTIRSGVEDLCEWLTILSSFPTYLSEYPISTDKSLCDRERVHPVRKRISSSPFLPVPHSVTLWQLGMFFPALLTPLNSTSLSFFTEFDCRACHSHFKEWGDRCEWFTIENDSSVVCVD